MNVTVFDSGNVTGHDPAHLTQPLSTASLLHSSASVLPDSSADLPSTSVQSNKAKKKRKTQRNQSIYVNSFDKSEAVERCKMLRYLTVKSDCKFETHSNKEDVENALYNENDLTVKCMVKGIFADALVQMNSLLEEGEVLPEFRVSLATGGSEGDVGGEVITSDYPVKTQYHWHHRAPI